MSFEAWKAKISAELNAQLRPFFQTVQHLPEVVAKDKSQAEFTKSISAYLEPVLTPETIRQGQEGAARHAHALKAAEEAYGVPHAMLTALWGVETRYGTMRGSWPILSALATLAYEGRRAAFFTQELHAALDLCHLHAMPPDQTGSWAGAIGHTQFMPSSLLRFGVGDRAVWTENPVTALSCAGAYLGAHGWERGDPWAERVTCPAEIDPALLDGPQEPQVWCAAGIATARGGSARLWLPAGAAGPAFLVGKSFDSLRAYNRSDHYVLAVGLLAQAIGGQPWAVNWPDLGAPLSRAEMQSLQSALSAHGFDTQGADGLWGPNSASALRRWQVHADQWPDGYPTRAVLAALG